MDIEKCFKIPTKELLLPFSERFTIGGVNFLVQADKSYQIEYIRRVVEGSTSSNEALGERNVKILIITDPKGEKAAKIIRDFPENLIIYRGKEFLYGGEVSSGTYYFISNAHLFINITQERDSEVVHICMGPHPELGASSFIKINLLHFYREKFPDFVVFHAGSIIHLSTSRGIVFSTPKEKNRGNALGKTTAVLAATLNKSRNFGYCSNDEVLLSLHRPGSLEIFPFPNEIPIREGTLNEILREGYYLELEEWCGFDEETKERVFVTTPGLLTQRGVSIAKLNNITAWVFIDLSPERKTYIIESLEEQAAQDRFISSIFQKRMAQTRGNLHWAEMGTEQKDNKLLSSEIETARKIFLFLFSGGTRFFSLEGGTDREKLQEIFCRIVENN
jgi:hypothetical protein